MTGEDPIWHEIFDAERRLAAIEQQLAVLHARDADQATDVAARSATRRYVFSTLVGVVSTVAFVLSLLSQLGVHL